MVSNRLIVARRIRKLMASLVVEALWFYTRFIRTITTFLALEASILGIIAVMLATCGQIH